MWIVIISLFVIISFLYGSVIMKTIKDKIDMDFDRNRYNPLYMPFIGFSEKAPGNNYFDKTFKNFSYVSSSVVNASIDNATRPLTMITSGIHKGIGKVGEMLNKFRDMASVIRVMFKTIVGSVIEKINNGRSAMTYLTEKLKVILKKQSAMFALIVQLSKSIKFLGYSLVYGHHMTFIKFLPVMIFSLIALIVSCLICPIPVIGWVACPICLACFPGETLVNTPNGRKEISKIKLGEKLESGSVIGVIKFRVQDMSLYKIGDSWITGDHLIKEGEWKRVKDAKYSQMKEYTGILYCLMTTDNQIRLGEIICADYSETNNIETYKKIKGKYLKQLNAGGNEERPTGFHWGGFGKDVKINGKKISKIKIGEFIGKESQVVGVIQMISPDYVCDGNIITTGAQIRRKEGKYEFVGGEIKEGPIILNHLMTSNHKIEIEGIEYRDFFDSLEENVNQEIDSILMNSKNNNIPIL